MGSLLSKPLNEALNEAANTAEVIAQKYATTASSQVPANMIRKSLAPLLQGIVVGHFDQVPPGEIEDALINVFTVALIDLLKRQHKPTDKPEDVAKSVQQVINFTAETLTEQIYAVWGPKIVIPETGGKPN